MVLIELFKVNVYSFLLGIKMDLILVNYVLEGLIFLLFSKLFTHFFNACLRAGVEDRLLSETGIITDSDFFCFSQVDVVRREARPNVSTTREVRFLVDFSLSRFDYPRWHIHVNVVMLFIFGQVFY
jgi:hypothetical protein